MTSLFLSSGSSYTWLLLVGVAVTLLVWVRLARRDDRLLIIYLAALISAFLGAKLVYLAAEGWLYYGHPQRWLIWAAGKTILGAFLGGYAGVEVAKKLLGYGAPTGDFFAFVAPIGIITGRVGCLVQGCCLGQPCAPHWWTLTDKEGISRWPAVPLEIGFNLVALAVFAALRARRAPAGRLNGQYFHLYLIAYGVFRFLHEFRRATPQIALHLSGYQMAAIAVFVVGLVGFVQRDVARRGARSASV